MELHLPSGVKPVAGEISVSEQPIHETTTEARAGTGPGVMRYVLAASMVLVIAAFIVIVSSGWMG